MNLTLVVARLIGADRLKGNVGIRPTVRSLALEVPYEASTQFSQSLETRMNDEIHGSRPHLGATDQTEWIGADAHCRSDSDNSTPYCGKDERLVVLCVCSQAGDGELGVALTHPKLHADPEDPVLEAAAHYHLCQSPLARANSRGSQIELHLQFGVAESEEE